MAAEELLFKKYRRKWRIGSKRVYPNKIDEQEPVFSEYIDSKLPKKVVSKLRSWVKTLNHVMWGGKDYDTLDSLTRVLNPEEVFAHYSSSLYVLKKTYLAVPKFVPAVFHRTKTI